jgi:hypothetical protein
MTRSLQASRNQDSDCRRMIYETSDRTAQCFAISLMVQSFDMTRPGFNITAPVHARVSVGSIVVWKEDGQISGTKVLQNLKLVVLKYKTLVPSTSVELHLPQTSPGEDHFYFVSCFIRVHVRCDVFSWERLLRFYFE